MSQHDYDIANQAGAAFRADLNNALLAIVGLNSGASAPSTTYPYMLWADTANDLLKVRNAGNTAWVSLLTLSTGAVADTTVAKVGKQTLAVPALAMTVRTTSGPAAGSVETTTNKVMLKTLDFDSGTAEYAQFAVRMPKSWNEGTVTAEVQWSSNVSGTNSVVWGIQGVAIGDDDVLDAAFGTAVTVTDAQTAQGDLMKSAETSAITIAGTPAAGDWVVFQVYRDAANGSDTLAGDARLHGVTVFYTTDGQNDA